MFLKNMREPLFISFIFFDCPPFAFFFIHCAPLLPPPPPFLPPCLVVIRSLGALLHFGSNDPFLPSLVSSLILPLIQQSKFTRLVHIHHILISLASAHFGGPGRVGPLPLWRAGYNETRPQSVNNSPLLKREMERVLLTLMWMWTRKDASDDKKKNKKHPSRTFKRLFPSTVTRDFIRL